MKCFSIIMAQQQQQRIPFVFQGNTFYYKTESIQPQMNTGNELRYQSTVYDSDNAESPCIGHIETMFIYNEETNEWDEINKNLRITSRQRYTYIYDLETEQLLHFIYSFHYIYTEDGNVVGIQANHNMSPQEIQQLEIFNRYIVETNAATDMQGVFHILDMDERIPQEQVELGLK